MPGWVTKFLSQRYLHGQGTEQLCFAKGHCLHREAAVSHPSLLLLRRVAETKPLLLIDHVPAAMSNTAEQGEHSLLPFVYITA